MFPTTTKPEMTTQFEAGRKAGLTNPHAACPYETPEEITAWHKGLEAGVGEIDARNCILTQTELAQARGWNSGFYAPNAYCPYSGPLIQTWTKGFLAGHDAARKLKDRFGSPRRKKISLKRTNKPSDRRPFVTVAKEGRTASDVTDPGEIKRIWKAYKRNGGTLTYTAIEKEFDLRPNNGMNAYRVCRKYS